MNKSNTKKAQVQGTDAPVSQVPRETKSTDTNRDQVKSWLEKDLKMAISLLTALYTDPDLLNAIADFMHGRIMNDKAKQALENQTDLPL